MKRSSNSFICSLWSGFAVDNGYGWETDDIGHVQAVGGAGMLVMSLVIYPEIVERYTTLVTFRGLVVIPVIQVRPHVEEVLQPRAAPPRLVLTCNTKTMRRALCSAPALPALRNGATRKPAITKPRVRDRAQQ